MLGEFSSLKRKDTLRVFWRFIVNSLGGHIYVHKEISLWRIVNGQPYRREIHRRQPLRYEVWQVVDAPNGSKRVIPSLTHENNVFVSEGKICFSGKGFLKIFDHGLRSDLYEFERLLSNGKSQPVRDSDSELIEVIDQLKPGSEILVNNSAQYEQAVHAFFDKTASNDDRFWALSLIREAAETCERITAWFARNLGIFDTDEGIDADNLYLVRVIDGLEEPVPQVDQKPEDPFEDLTVRVQKMEELLNIVINCFHSVELEEEGNKEEVKIETYFMRGENIRLEVDFETANEKGTHPIFYYNQGQNDEGDPFGKIYLREIVSEAGRQAGASISRRDFDLSPPYVLQGEHKLTFSDDEDLFNRKMLGEQPQEYFELLVDSIPLVVSRNYSSHWFDIGPKEFYVGFNPEDPDNMFKGSIRSLICDPSLPCGGC